MDISDANTKIYRYGFKIFFFKIHKARGDMEAVINKYIEQINSTFPM